MQAKIVDNKKIAKNMENLFEKDILHCHELTFEDYGNRSKLIKFKEAISILVSDIL